jgi:hypothetical protein
MATVLEKYTTEEQCSLVRFLRAKGLNVKDIRKERCPVYGGTCLSRKAVHICAAGGRVDSSWQEDNDRQCSSCTRVFPWFTIQHKAWSFEVQANWQEGYCFIMTMPDSILTTRTWALVISICLGRQKTAMAKRLKRRCGSGWENSKKFLCCRFRGTGKAMGQAYQCWWRICREINVFYQVRISHVLRFISICDLFTNSSSYVFGFGVNLRRSGTLTFTKHVLFSVQTSFIVLFIDYRNISTAAKLITLYVSNCSLQAKNNFTYFVKYSQYRKAFKNVRILIRCIDVLYFIWSYNFFLPSAIFWDNG